MLTSTVSHGTLRTQDLLPAFLDTLQHFDRAQDRMFSLAN